MTRILPLLAALSLSACAAVVVLPTEPDGGIGTTDTCGADALQVFVGQPPSALDAVRLTQPFRVIRPGEMVTMDFLPERVNFRVGEDGRIAEVTCG
jgi:hypothetical protein